jgi:purine-nucleoside phosphorylase
MSLHLAAQPGEISETVLITGDPLRAKHYAEELLSDSVCYNSIRGMLGYTGVYRGKRISIQGTGIGIPSTALYVHELIHSYGVKRIIRVGTCGAIQSDISLGQVIVAEKAWTDSSVIMALMKSNDRVPANATLLNQVMQSSSAMNIPIRSGAVFSTDLFYSDDDPMRWNEPIQQGVLAVEMETAVVYALAKKNNIQALSILTVSDHILKGETASASDRETKTTNMMKLALEVGISPF